MSETGKIIFDTASRIFEDLSTAEVINAAENGQWPEALWQAIVESGLTLTWISEEAGGVGADMLDGFAVLKAAGGAAVPVPLAETMMAGWLQAKAGLPVGSEPMSVVIGGLHWDGEVLNGSVTGIPHGRNVKNLVVILDSEEGAIALCCKAGDVAVRPVAGLSGEPWDTLEFKGVKPDQLGALQDGVDEAAAQALGALIRCAQASGAMAQALELTIQYSMERVQFGRPLAKFQALQHSIAAFAGQVAAINAATDSAAETLARNNRVDNDTWVEIAAAKTRLEEAVNEGAAVAHQVHGAMGFTYEHQLHHLTRRLWSWRDEYGSDAVWSVRLGDEVLKWGAEALWPKITAVSNPR